ncbi:DctP family TRAP transporter solute-binding subunit [Cohnella kolymensis]|uniref:DctP family TRAP transporter solute-binding subunit n=1 Tax=Cohnella kolymensis TaxID=1590652 RepID=UPI0006988EE2|nr:DctP family TRAP transporter solute-binding subunit [Cohnella kolymensis]
MVNKKVWASVLSTIVLAAIVISGCSSKSASNSNSSSPAGTPSNAGGKTVTLKITHFQPGTEDQPAHAASLQFKEYVEKQTNGSIKVEIYPASQLGDANVVLEGMKLGSIQMGIVHDGPVASVYAPVGVFNLPYLFKDQNEAWSVFDSDFTKKLSEDMASKTGLRFLALADNGIRHFTNSKHEIKSIADLKGLKMRIQPGKLYEEFMKATGASPSTIGWTELPAALEQKVVDGQENGVTNILAASMYQTQKYVTLDGHIYSFHAYLISDKFFQSLTPAQQKAIVEGVNQVKATHRNMTSDQDKNAAKILSDKGMTVTELSAEEIDKFRQATQPAVVEWMKKEMGSEWVDGILKEVDSVRKG